jgi:glycine dehydrogenase
VRSAKYWPSVARIDNAYGDRHLFCSCVPMSELAEAEGEGSELAVAVT